MNVWNNSIASEPANWIILPLLAFAGMLVITLASGFVHRAVSTSEP